MWVSGGSALQAEGTPEQRPMVRMVRKGLRKTVTGWEETVAVGMREGW